MLRAELLVKQEYARIYREIGLVTADDWLDASDIEAMIRSARKEAEKGTLAMRKRAHNIETQMGAFVSSRLDRQVRDLKGDELIAALKKRFPRVSERRLQELIRSPQANLLLTALELPTILEELEGELISSAPVRAVEEWLKVNVPLAVFEEVPTRAIVRAASAATVSGALAVPGAITAATIPAAAATTELGLQGPRIRLSKVPGLVLELGDLVVEELGKLAKGKAIELLRGELTEAAAKKVAEQAAETAAEQLVKKTVQEALQESEAKTMQKARSLALKRHGEITKERHLAAGIEGYFWTDSNDSRVRPIHYELGYQSDRGKVFYYADPPVISEDGRRGNPGDDYNCRCTAFPVL